jgi:hypothetical protein
MRGKSRVGLRHLLDFLLIARNAFAELGDHLHETA